MPKIVILSAAKDLAVATRQEERFFAFVSE
jgi:hypothetical protein